MWEAATDLNIKSLLNSGSLYGKEHFLFYLLLSTEAMQFLLVLVPSVIAYGKPKIVLDLYLHSCRFVMTKSPILGSCCRANFPAITLLSEYSYFSSSYNKCMKSHSLMKYLLKLVNYIFTTFLLLYIYTSSSVLPRDSCNGSHLSGDHTKCKQCNPLAKKSHKSKCKSHQYEWHGETEKARIISGHGEQ